MQLKPVLFKGQLSSLFSLTTTLQTQFQLIPKSTSVSSPGYLVKLSLNLYFHCHCQVLIMPQLNFCSKHQTGFFISSSLFFPNHIPECQQNVILTHESDHIIIWEIMSVACQWKSKFLSMVYKDPCTLFQPHLLFIYAFRCTCPLLSSHTSDVSFSPSAMFFLAAVFSHMLFSLPCKTFVPCLTNLAHTSRLSLNVLFVKFTFPLLVTHRHHIELDPLFSE